MGPAFRTVQCACARLSAVLLSGLIAVCAHSAQRDAAADFPARPIRFIVPFTAGAGTDITARTIAGKLSEILEWRRLVRDAGLELH